MKIRVLTAASRDLIRAKKFYEQQDEHLGDYFVDSLSADIDSLLIYAGTQRKVRDYFCMLSKRFPYAIYYRVESNEIRIYRVLDCRQNPSKTIKALPDPT
jgi:plasmid stabilization system protein ParE